MRRLITLMESQELDTILKAFKNNNNFFVLEYFYLCVVLDHSVTGSTCQNEIVTFINRNEMIIYIIKFHW